MLQVPHEVEPGSGAQQRAPAGHGWAESHWPALEHVPPSPPEVGHIPGDRMRSPARAASHALGYVVWSQPHTGLTIALHVVGRGTHVPAPEHASVPLPPAQYSVAVHCALLVQLVTPLSCGGPPMQHPRHAVE